MKTYSLQDVHCTLTGPDGALLLTGTADDAIEIEANEDLYTLQRGGDGRDMTRVRLGDDSAKVTIHTKQGSAVNDLLSDMMIADRLGAGVRACEIRDLNGTSLFSAPRMWIAKRPNVTWGKDAGERVWVLETDYAENYIGGALP